MPFADPGANNDLMAAYPHRLWNKETDTATMDVTVPPLTYANFGRAISTNTVSDAITLYSHKT